MHLDHISCILFVFPRRICWLLVDSVFLYQLVSIDKLVIIVCVEFALPVSIKERNLVASSVSH